ncbi:MAG TPA: hypothetical protein VER36_03775, partial [Flavisolibacter sp.]|nr:hypothetical protein [Flavisolibacter sp.]
MASTKYPVLRQTLIIVSFVALVGFFFALNLLIFIPQQQEAYHNKIFRVLHEVSEDFGRTATGRAEYFAKNRNRENTENNNNPLACDELKSNLLSSFETLKATRDTGKYQLTYAFKTDTITVSLNGAWSSAVSFPIADVLKPTVELLHKDIFDLL